MDLKDVHYDAFISYRHAKLDQFVATNLHRKLENFKLPKSVIAKLTQEKEAKAGDAKTGSESTGSAKQPQIKTKIERVFRDEDELPLSDNLSDPITHALNNSDFLIMICTPRYLESRWCMKEIEVFLQTHERKNILVVLAEGEPQDSFPEIITYEEYEEMQENGSNVTKRRELEPLAADTRGESNKEILKAMDTAVIKLAAAIFGLNFDDLKQRRREQKMKKMFTIFGSVAGVMSIVAVVMLILLMTISSQKKTIESQYSELEDKYASSMATAAESLLGSGRSRDALYAVRNVLPDTDKNGYNAEAYYMLNQILNAYTVGEKLISQNVFEIESKVFDYIVSPDNSYIAIEALNGDIYIFETDSENVLDIIKRERFADINDVAFTTGNALIYRDGYKTFKYDINSKMSEELFQMQTVAALYNGENGENPVCLVDDYLIGFNSDGSVSYQLDLQEVLNAQNLNVNDIAFDSNQMCVVLNDRNLTYVVYGDLNGNVNISFWTDGASDNRVDIDGDVIYLCQTFLNVDGTEPYSKVTAIDTVSTKTLWIKEYEGLACKNVIVSGSNVYVCGDYNIGVFGASYGNVVNKYAFSDALINAFEKDGQVWYVDTKGHINLVNDIATFDYTYTLMTAEPSEYAVGNIYRGENLYYLYANANYIAKYGNAENKGIATDDSEGNMIVAGDYEIKSAMDAISNIADVNEDFIKLAYYSTDEKVIAIEYIDGTISFYDAASYELINKLYDMDEEFVYLEYENDIDCYVYTSYSVSYILNDNLEIIAKTNAITDYENGYFEMINDKKYKVQFVNYNDMIKAADLMLSDYVPSGEVKDKYNIR